MISIRPVVSDDYETLSDWFEDPANNALFTSELRNIEEYKKIYLLIALKSKSNSYYMIEDGGGNCQGFIALINIDFQDRNGQLWYVTGNCEVRNRGVMTEAVRLILSRAKCELALHSVYTWVVEGNDASFRVLEKNGFHLYGRQREAFRDDDGFRDKLWFDKIL